MQLTSLSHSSIVYSSIEDLGYTPKNRGPGNLNLGSCTYNATHGWPNFIVS